MPDQISFTDGKGERKRETNAFDYEEEKLERLVPLWREIDPFAEYVGEKRKNYFLISNSNF